MNVRMTIVCGALLAGLFLPIAVSARRLEIAEARLEAGRELLRTTAADAERVLELRLRQERVAEDKRPEQDVIARVNACLARADIPLERFGGVRPEADAAVAGSADSARAYRRQSVRISLNRMTVAQVGAFLAAWHATQPLWTPTRIELGHGRDKADLDSYDASVLVAATYLADS